LEKRRQGPAFAAALSESDSNTSVTS